MVQVRTRAAFVVAFIGLVSALVAWSLVTPPSAPAADIFGETRTLFMSERFSPTAGPDRAALTGAVVPERIVALRGEREGFQFAIKNPTGSNLNLSARVLPDAALAAAQPAGAISFEILRAAFANVSTPSSSLDKKAAPRGMYQDALPPLRNDTAGGQLAIPGGQWGGIALLAAVRTNATPGTYGGTIELYDARSQDVYGRQAFTLDVRTPQLLQTGEKGSFKTVMHVEGDAYWLQHEAMRRGVKGTTGGFPTDPDRMLQLQGLMSFLDSRGISLNEQPFGGPSASGSYSCDYTSSAGTVPRFGFLEQTAQRYFGVERDIAPGTLQFPARMFPAATAGCASASGSFTNDFDGKIDKYRTPTIKQDDVLDPKAGAFWRSVASTWKARSMFGTNTYVKNPFDEPSNTGKNATDTKRRTAQYVNEVPKANKLLHAALKGTNTKVVLSDWPRDNKKKRVCRPGSCATISGDGFSNRKMWDGRGTDDVDVWVAPFSRLFGRPVHPRIKKSYKINNDREYADRLTKIKRLKGGREVWAYNFYTANSRQPQLTIDAPSTDARMNYWLLAREGHTGLYVSNTMLGWGTKVDRNPGGTQRKGNPWSGVNYFRHANYGVAAGWGTFIYPGYNPDLGLSTEADRNTASTRPVTTLRLEGMRDGQEDANLVQMYRTKFGNAKVQQLMKPIFPGTYVTLPSKLGQVVTPAYSNNTSLAQRMETQRRAMIYGLG
ncbi:MAG: hypothetical protein JWO69_1787 [Thermoleophilia bacterium]|nr:hypothetical protein [Thermoleophilia bacterium]